MIVVIDNYDSFVYNVVQCLGSLGAQTVVRKNDSITFEDIERIQPRGIVIGSGSGRPEEAGRAVEIVQVYAGRIPILGIGLGHQCVAVAFGGTVVAARQPLHGKAEAVEHDGQGLFAGLHLPFVATRYDSTVVTDVDLPPELVTTAHFAGGELAGLRHKTWPIETVQFDPGSVLTVNGQHMMQNFVAMTNKVRAA